MTSEQTDYSVTSVLDQLQISEQKASSKTTEKTVQTEKLASEATLNRDTSKNNSTKVGENENSTPAKETTLRRSARNRSKIENRNESGIDKSKIQNSKPKKYEIKTLSKVSSR